MEVMSMCERVYVEVSNTDMSVHDLEQSIHSPTHLFLHDFRADGRR